MRGRAAVARQAHNLKVLGSNPSPATFQKRAQANVLFLLGLNPRRGNPVQAPLPFTIEDRKTPKSYFIRG